MASRIGTQRLQTSEGVFSGCKVFSKREGRYALNDFGGARNQGESPLPMDIRGGKF